MIEIDFQCVFEVQGPFLSRSSTTGGFGVDAVPLRDRDGNALLPGSQVKGRVREAYHELFPEDQAILEFLGPKVDLEAIGSEELRPDGWLFGTFTAKSSGADSGSTPTSRSDGELLTRIALNGETGTVKSGALLVAELAVPIGEVDKFTGRVTLSARDWKAATVQYQKLRSCLGWVASVGSFRSVGFGTVKKMTVTPTDVRVWGDAAKMGDAPAWVAGANALPVQPQANPVASPLGSTTSRLLRVRFEEPFCVGERRHDRNVYRSLTYLPGAVLKGAVAQQLKRVLGKDAKPDLTKVSEGVWSRLCQRFSDLRFLAAQPVAAASTRRPLETPASFFKVNANTPDDGALSEKDQEAAKHRVWDAARIDRPFLFKSGETETAPEFAIDWKSSQTPGWETGRVSPIKELRLHTAIDSATRRAKDQHLFGHELVLSQGKDDNGHTVDVEFLGKVMLPEAWTDDRRTEVWSDLESLFSAAVLRIGKTKARAKIEFVDAPNDPTFVSTADEIPINAAGDKGWVVVLQSPSLMIDPKILEDDWTEGVDATTRLYEEYFAEASSSDSGSPRLRLVNSFRNESLQGGYLVHRSRRIANNGYDSNGYEPYYVTESGSTFVLAPVENTPEAIAAAKKDIVAWMHGGLPLPEWAEKRYGTSFLENPFLPCDGFAEVSVNVPAQCKLAVKEEEVRRL